ncbi:MAG: hypothetical protein AB1486_19970 [Planctomycetota bacterium]
MPRPCAAPDAASPWIDLRATVHVHSEASRDSQGTLEEILGAARAVGTDVVVLADHNNRDQAPHEGWHGSVLLVVGEEKGGGDHILGIGHAGAISSRQTRPELVRQLQEAGGVAFSAHPAGESREDLAAELEVVDGIEVYNLSTDIHDEGAIAIALKRVFGLTFLPRTTVRSVIDPPWEGLRLWDSALAARPCVGIASVDAHGAHGLTYELSFRVAQTHLLVSARTKAAVLDALRAGRCYMTFEIFSPVPYFTFEVHTPGARLVMGSTGAWQPGTVARVVLPESARLCLRRDGEHLAEQEGKAFEFLLPSPGTYRVEAWRGDQLWIASNPVRLTEAVP